MKFETAVGTLGMALAAIAFLLIASGAIGPPKATAKPAKPASVVTSKPGTSGAEAVLPTRAPLEVTPPSGELSDAAARDARRLSDLQAIADALNAYRAKKSSYPSSGGRVQTACQYKDLDKLCVIAGDVGGIENLTDARGNSFGYWYVSDGAKFTLFASLEGSASGSDPCPEGSSFIKLPNVFCLNSYGN